MGTIVPNINQFLLHRRNDFLYIVVYKNMIEEPTLTGQFEELVVRAVALEGEGAYGVSIRQRLCDATGRDVSIGAVYTTLDRLEEKGFIKSWMGEPTAERGGRAKKHFLVEAAGLVALTAAETARGALPIIPSPTQLRVGASQ